MHVAITDFTSYKASVVARYLKLNYSNIRITSVDCRKYSRLLHSKYSDHHIVARAENVSDPAYVDELAELVRKEKIDVLIPINSQELGILLAQREKFGSAMQYWGTLKDYSSLHDKARFQKIVQQAGLAIPHEYADLKTALIPFVFKPTTSSSSKGVVYAHNEHERQKLIEAERKKPTASFIIQQFIAGEGVGFAGFFNEGQVMAGHAHKRLAEFPVSGGSSVYRSSLSGSDHHQISIVVEQLLKHIPWSGFAMFEFKMTAKGELFFIECNPRIWGSIHQGLTNGTNYFSSLLGKGKNVENETKKKNTYLSPLLWASFLAYAFKGNYSPLKAFLRNWQKNKSDIGLLQDPLGWLALVMRSF